MTEDLLQSGNTFEVGVAIDFSEDGVVRDSRLPSVIAIKNVNDLYSIGEDW